MAASDKSTIGANFNQSGSGYFLTNVIRAITSASLRLFVDAILQSYPNIIDDALSGLKGLKPGINTIAALKAISTISVPTGAIISFRDTGNSDLLRSYELVAGTDVENSPAIIRPTDYAASTNEKVWKQLVSVINTVINISSAEILGLNAVPKVLIPSQGANKVIIPLAVYVLVNGGTTSYATHVDCTIKRGALNVYPMSNLLTQAVNTSFGQAGINATLSGATGANDALTISADGGNPTTGNKTLKVWISYTVIDIS